MTEEQKYWRQLVDELRDEMTMAEIAEAAGVDDRQVWRWLEGDRPKGLTAIRVYLLHVKRCPQGRCPPDHSQEIENP